MQTRRKPWPSSPLESLWLAGFVVVQLVLLWQGFSTCLFGEHRHDF